MTIDEITSRTERGHHTVSARIRTQDHADRLFFRWRGEACVLPGDAFFLAALQPAMFTGRDLTMRHPLSEPFIDSIDDIKDGLRSSSRNLASISTRIENPKRAVDDGPSWSGGSGKTGAPVGAKLKTGLFFTGDLDSYFTLHHHRDEIDTLVHVPNLDSIPSPRHPAKELKKDLLVLETNLKHFFEPFGADGGLNPSLGLAVIGTVLSGHLMKLYIPRIAGSISSSGKEDGALGPWYCSHRMSFDRDGAGRDRTNKIDIISGDKTLLDIIRVCWENPGRSYNCGRCSTCTRTLSAHQSLSALD